MLAEYRVQLDVFDGPMDLLLHLIQRHEVDIGDIPIAMIADQYIEHVKQLDRIDMERAGDFLLLAATLMEIKSRMIARESTLSPDDDGNATVDPRDTEDPRSELVRQLLAYRMFRDAADALEDRRHVWDRRYPGGRIVPPADTLADLRDQEPEIELDDIDLLDLARAFAMVAAAVDFDRLGEHEVVHDDTPIELHAADMHDNLVRYRNEGKADVALATLLTGRNRAEMLGLFLALLELVKEQRVRVTLNDTDGVRIAVRDEPEQIADRFVEEEAS